MEEERGPPRVSASPSGTEEGAKRGGSNGGTADEERAEEGRAAAAADGAAAATTTEATSHAASEDISAATMATTLGHRTTKAEAAASRALAWQTSNLMTSCKDTQSKLVREGVCSVRSPQHHYSQREFFCGADEGGNRLALCAHKEEGKGWR